MKPAGLLIAASVAALLAQAPAGFEVISIKPTPKERLYRLNRDCKNGRFVAAGMPLSFIIAWSYQLDDSLIVDLPQWAKDWDLAYDIEAKTASPVNGDPCKLMVQALLADRFKMAAHRDTREMRAYALTVAKTGPKIQKVTGDDGAGVILNGARFQSLSDAEPPKGLSMSRLVGILTNHPAVGLPVVDKTGLDGNYSFKLTFSMKDGDDRPSVFTAVQEQLGLKLEATKAPVGVLVVDHIEKASGN